MLTPRRSAMMVTIALLLMTGCVAAPPAPARVARIPPSAAQPEVDDTPLRAERVSIAFDDADRVASLLERALVHGPPNTGAVRAVLVDRRSGELVIVGTDAGIARARTFLSPGLLEPTADDDL